MAEEGEDRVELTDEEFFGLPKAPEAFLRFKEKRRIQLEGLEEGDEIPPRITEIEYTGEEGEREELESMPIPESKISDEDIKRLKKGTSHLPFANVMSMMEDFGYNVDAIIAFCKNMVVPQFICPQTEQLILATSSGLRKKRSSTVINNQPLYQQFFQKHNIREHSNTLVEYYQNNKKRVPVLEHTQHVKSRDTAQMDYLKHKNVEYFCDLADERRKRMEERRLERLAQLAERKAKKKEKAKAKVAPADDKQKRVAPKVVVYSPEPADRVLRKGRNVSPPVNEGASSSGTQVLSDNFMGYIPTRSSGKKNLNETKPQDEPSTSTAPNNQTSKKMKKKKGKQPTLKLNFADEARQLRNHMQKAEIKSESTSSMQTRSSNPQNIVMGKEGNDNKSGPLTPPVAQKPQIVVQTRANTITTPKEATTSDGKKVIRHVVKQMNLPWDASEGKGKDTPSTSGSPKKSVTEQKKEEEPQKAPPVFKFTKNYKGATFEELVGDAHEIRRRNSVAQMVELRPDGRPVRKTHKISYNP